MVMWSEKDTFEISISVMDVRRWFFILQRMEGNKETSCSGSEQQISST